jgi:transaldolase/glucose-6-phosphate isomerase
VNAFNQPDVQDNKTRTKTKITEYQKDGSLPIGEAVRVKEAGSALEEFLKQTNPNDYFAINAYLPRDAKMIDELQKMRIALRAKTGCAVTLGFGPRFLHSTGQLHKGGPPNGLFLVITADPAKDIDIPNMDMSFGTLELAQALGDYEALIGRGRRVLRVHLDRPNDVGGLTNLIN